VASLGPVHNSEASPLTAECVAGLDGRVGAVLAEQHDEWAEQRRYLGLDLMARCRAVLNPTTTQEVNQTAIAGGPSA